MMSLLKKWYFRSYEQDKLDIDRSVVGRFSRGNVLVQEGRYITDLELDELSAKGDEALSRLPGAV